jgi:hypothetical protein
VAGEKALLARLGGYDVRGRWDMRSSPGGSTPCLSTFLILLAAASVEPVSGAREIAMLRMS